MQSDTLEERYAIKLCFKLGKNATETYGMLQTAFLAWVEHQFLSGIRDSRKAGSLWEMMRCLGGVRKSIHHSWLAKGLGLGLLCWGFKGVQEEIHTRGLRWGLPEVVGTVQQVHCSRRRLLRRGLEFHACTINKSGHMKKVWKLIVCPS